MGIKNKSNIILLNQRESENCKKLILHVGIHKTGTTNIQRVLYENRDWLAERGLFYPVSFPFLGSRAHHNFAHAFTNNRYEKRKKVSEFLKSALISSGPNDTIIISSEPLYRHLLGGSPWEGLLAEDYFKTRNAYLAKLSDALKDFEVEVVLYFRDYAYWLPWLHGVLKRKKFWMEGLDRFKQEFGQRFDYEKQLELFSAHFSKIRTFQYEEAMQEGLISHFFRAIGFPVPPGSEDVWERPSKKFKAPKRKAIANISNSNMAPMPVQNVQEDPAEDAPKFPVAVVAQTIRVSSPLEKAASVPPGDIPAGLRDRYTLNGAISVQHRYFNQTKSEPRRLTIDKYTKVLNALAVGTFQYQGNMLKRLFSAIHDFSLTGKNVCVFGAVNVDCDAICLFSGAEKVTILGDNIPHAEHPQVECLSLKDALQEGLKWEAALSIGSFSRKGLGRYGAPLDPDGDLRAMEEARRLIKRGGLFYLGVPVGMDCVVWNSHRIYGKKRLPMLLDSWQVEKTYGYSKKLHSLPLGKHKKPVFMLRNVE